MSTAVNRAAHRNMSKASQMVNAANLAQRQDSSAMHSDEDFSSFSAQALANEEYFNKLL
jgi:hypothetical protein